MRQKDLARMVIKLLETADASARVCEIEENKKKGLNHRVEYWT